MVDIINHHRVTGTNFSDVSLMNIMLQYLKLIDKDLSLNP